MSTTSFHLRKSIDQRIAFPAIILLWVCYTTIQTLNVTGYITEPWSAILSFVPGVLGVGVLKMAGFTWKGLFLRIAPLSWKGFAVLAGIFVFALAAILPFGKWQGWSWAAALVYAPASGISQELFFRSALLPASLFIFKGRPYLALILQAAFFGLWHIGPFFLGAPVWIVFAVMLVPFVSGIGWGWQVMHDRTVLWAVIQHTLIWVVAGQFPMPE